MAREKRPQLDPAARKLLYIRIADRFISPMERRARVETVVKVLGYKTLSRFCYDHGMYPATVNKSIDSSRPGIFTIYKLCVALGVSISYLTEKDYFKKGPRDG